MPYVMSALVEYRYVCTNQPLGEYETFKSFLEDYPRMKAFYGDKLSCQYVSPKSYYPTEIDFAGPDFLEW